MMQRTTRNRPLTPEEAARYREIREKIDAEVPELLARHAERQRALLELETLFPQLKAAREARGLSLRDLTSATWPDLESLERNESSGMATTSNVVTLVTLMRYAEAVGKRLVVTLEDA